MPDRPSNPATDPTIAPAAVAATMAPAAAPSAPAAAGPGALRPGMVVAETYEITRLLGQGGMGAVWEAKHLRLPGKRVVVKVLLFGATDAVVLARFRREAEIASRLGHPNIVQVLDFNTLPDGTPYIVLELLQGESLAARLASGPCRARAGDVDRDARSARRWPPRTGKGIVHRDLKPDNIFLCPTDLGGEVRDVVKVLDFGISKIRGSKTVLTQDAALLGTPQYMAPEQATGRNDEIDARTDMFAFGAMTFEMLAGQAALHGGHAGGGHSRDRVRADAVAAGRWRRDAAGDRRRRSSGRWRRTATRASRTSTASSRRSRPQRRDRARD